MKKIIFCLALAFIVLTLVGFNANAICPDCSAVVWINDDDQCFLEVTACLRDYGEGNYVIWYRPEYLLGYKALGLEYIEECDTNCHIYHAVFEIDCAALHYVYFFAWYPNEPGVPIFHCEFTTVYPPPK